MNIKTDYNNIAKSYNERYTVNYLNRIEKSLLDIASNHKIFSILEAGCGTGRWLNALSGLNKNLFGLDYSFGMLKIASSENRISNLVNGNACFLPFSEHSFDMIFCVNAIHHFPYKEKFFSEAYKVLSKNGVLCIYGVDPYADKNWFVYDYFDNVYEKDLERFPSLGKLRILCNRFNLIPDEQSVIEHIYIERTGEEVFADPFLKKNMSSQLANLTDEEYRHGINKIRYQINKEPNTKFTTDIIFYLTKAHKGD